MVITASSFENPPPKSLDKEAAARVSKVTSKRDKRRRESRNQSVAPVPEETVSSQEKPEVLESVKRQQSVEKPEVITRLKQNVQSRSISKPDPNNNLESPDRSATRKTFQEKAAAIEARQKQFQESEGFKRVRTTAEALTPKGLRGTKAGEVFTGVTEGFLSGPIQAGGLVATGTEKLVATTTGVFRGEIKREDVIAESKRAGKETLKTFDPTTTEGQITFVSAGLGAFTGIRPNRVRTRSVGEAETFTKTDLNTGTSRQVTTQEVNIQAGKDIIKASGEAETIIRRTSDQGAIATQESFITAETPKGKVRSGRRLDSDIIIEGDRTTAFGTFLETTIGKKGTTFVGAEKTTGATRGGRTITTTESSVRKARTDVDPTSIDNVVNPPKTKGRTLKERSVGITDEVLSIDRTKTTPAELIVEQTPFGTVEVIKPSRSNTVRETVSETKTFSTKDRTLVSSRESIPQTKNTLTDITESGKIEVNIIEGNRQGVQVVKKPSGENKPLIPPRESFVKTSNPQTTVTTNPQTTVTLVPSNIEAQAVRAIRAETPIVTKQAPVPTTGSFGGLEVAPRLERKTQTSSGPTGRDLSRSFSPPQPRSVITSPIKKLVSENIVSPISDQKRGSSSKQNQLPETDITTLQDQTLGRSQERSLRQNNILLQTSIVDQKRTVLSRTPAPRLQRTSFPRNIVTPSLLLNRQKPSKEFTVQVFRKGQFETVGRATTQKRAIGLGKKVVGGNELRSFRVLQQGKPIKVQEDKQIRKKKRDPFVFVERSKFAINTPGEVFAIPGASKRQRKKR
jgi:hypothetical protein